MSAENVQYIREIIKDIPEELREGYGRALKDMMSIAGEVPYYGMYVDAEVSELARNLAKAKGVAIAVR